MRTVSFLIIQRYFPFGSLFQVHGQPRWCSRLSRLSLFSVMHLLARSQSRFGSVYCVHRNMSKPVIWIHSAGNAASHDCIAAWPSDIRSKLRQRDADVRHDEKHRQQYHAAPLMRYLAVEDLDSPDSFDRIDYKAQLADHI